MRPSVRFAVLQRDEFRCRYCGRTAAATLQLHVDHIHPRSKGGSDTLDNLVTACSECNIGKGARPLTVIPAHLPRPTYRTLPRLPKSAPPGPFGWRDDLFTPDQLAIIARVQNRGRAA